MSGLGNGPPSSALAATAAPRRKETAATVILCRSDIPVHRRSIPMPYGVDDCVILIAVLLDRSRPRPESRLRAGVVALHNAVELLAVALEPHDDDGRMGRRVDRREV